MKLLRRMLRREAGQALPMALILMLLGGLLIIPTLDFTTTNLKATQAVDQHTRELYAADAGIEDALWYLQSEDRVAIKNPTDTWPMPTYHLDENINTKDVQVTIDHAWLLSNLAGLPATEPLVGQSRYANDHWTVIGALNIDVNPHNNFIVDITTNEDASTASLDHIGIWLPQGYSITGNVKINGVAIGGIGDPLHLVKNPGAPVAYRGGNVYKWDYLGTTFKQLSDISPGSSGTPQQKFPPSVRLSFDYDVTPFKEARGFFPWIMLSSLLRTAWDADSGFYHVVSTSFTPPTDNTTVEAYVPKGVIRYVSGSSGATSAIQGDYIAIGNSLMTCCWNSTCNGSPTGPSPTCTCTCGTTTCCGNNPYRNYAPAPAIFTGTPTTDLERESYRESSATVNPGGVPPNVPSDAKIERAYLYWTAWLRGDKVWEESSAPQHGPGSWQWTSCMGVDSNGNDKWGPCSLRTTPTVQYVKTWLAANAYDGNALLAVNGVKVTPINAGDPAGTVVANTWYISQGSSDVQPSYQYACFADVTAQVKDTPNLSGATFTVAGVQAHPAIPHSGGKCDTNDPSITWSRSANAGWSMVIIYSSPQKKTHQIYVYPGCQHLFNTTSEFTIAGFAAPLTLEPGETNNDAKMTVFASEGDVNSPAAEYLGFKGQTTAYYQLYDVSGNADVFNSISNFTGFTPSSISTCQTGVGIISGIDIDTYTHTNTTVGTPLYSIVHPGDISANIKVQSLGDGFELIYVVFSVRSTAVPAGTEFDVGTMMYTIK